MTRSRLRAVALAALLLIPLGATLLLAPAAHGRGLGHLPNEIQIPAIGVDAPIETLSTVAGQMQEPTSPDVVAWYDDSARLGVPGNTVLAGHLDFAGVGPAIFADLADLKRGDLILMTDETGTVYRYRVESRRVVDAVTGPWPKLTGPTDRPSLTLITCAPPWDYSLGFYTNRLVVRAVRIHR